MDILTFEPFSTLIHPTFWHRLTQLKLNVFQLDESAIELDANYSIERHRGFPPQLTVDYTAFDSNEKSQSFYYPCKGKLYNTNTVEGFQKLCCRASLISSCEEVLGDINSGNALENPSLLNRFIFLCYGDFKRYHFHYWLAFPAISLPEPFVLESKPQSIGQNWTPEKIENFTKQLTHPDEAWTLSPFFAYSASTGELMRLAKVKASEKLENVIFCFGDPSLSESFGWPLRNFLLLVQQHFCNESFSLSTVNFLAIRRSKGDDHKYTFSDSLIFSIQMRRMPELKLETCSLSGWERDRRSGKLQPAFADMSRSMDPVKLASEAVNLNLRLMKWRVAPELQLNKIGSTKCLLLGCGTLGCNVARCLLSWGVHEMALVDNGKISFSNPVRQSLFNFKHCVDSKTMKADAAADSLRKIFPGVTVSSYPELTIPMPGHPISPSTLEATKKNWEQLDTLIRENDVVFLLTDSRESRWLPSVIAAAYGKLAITTALGFDSFLVMRHGFAKGSGAKLGCYFCTDVVGPTNSLRDRTLDQQCTVSRGGVSMIASGLAVELMVSVLNHPLGAAASANSNDDCLGIVPHQLRGFLSKFEQLSINSPSFQNCSACSTSVMNAYLKDGFNFVKRVCSNPDYLEEVSGLAELQRESAKLSLEDFCTSDDELVQ